MFYRFPTVALLACCCKCLPENAAIDSVTLYAPELVDVVEVADTRGGYVSDKDGFEFFGQNGFQRVGHDSCCPLVEHERVLVGDGVGDYPVACGYVNCKRNRQRAVAGAQEYSNARVFVCLADVLRAEQLEGEIIVDADCADCAEYLSRFIVRQSEAPNRSVQVLRRTPVDAYERADEHASLHNHALTPR